MKKQLPILALCLTLTLTACGPKNPEKAETSAMSPAVTTTPEVAVPSESQLPAESWQPTESQSPAESAIPAPKWKDQMTTVTTAADDGIELLRFEMQSPYIENAGDLPAFEVINTFYDQAALEFKAAAQEEEAWARDDYAVSQASQFPFTPYVQQYTYLITRQTSRYVSISRELYTNTGGAYPTTYQFGEQFDLETGRQLVLADFFTDPDAALTIVREEIARQNAGAPELGIDESTLTAAFAPERFYLTDDGFVFYIQGSELGPFHNPVEYTVAYDLLEKELVTWIAD